MARSKVFIQLPDEAVASWKTDLTGHGIVSVGAEFVVRELWQYGKTRLMKGGRKLLVRVTSVDKQSRSFHVLSVDILKDLTPAPTITRPLFD